MIEIICVGKDQQVRTFFYEAVFDELDKTHSFSVYDCLDAKAADEAAFEMKFKVLNQNAWQQVGVHNNGEKYSAKGIIDAMLPELSAKYKVAILSSPKQAETGYGEEAIWRSVSATKMWNRLTQKGVAIYVAAADVYVYVGTSSD